MGYTWDKRVLGLVFPSGGAWMRHQGAMRRVDLLCLHSWGFGYPMSGNPELSWP